MGMCTFTAILALGSFTAVVLQDGTLLVPFTVLMCLLAFFFYRCLLSKDKKRDDDDDDDTDPSDVAVAMEDTVKSAKRIQSTRAMAALNAARRSLGEASESSGNAKDLKNSPPPGWAKYSDETTGRDFYFNETTGETQWDCPIRVSV